MNYLLGAVDRDAQDAGFVAERFATFTPVAAETEVHCGAAVDFTIDGQGTGTVLKRVVVNHADLKTWTLPHTITLPCNIDSVVLGKDETADGNFTISRRAIGADENSNANNRRKATKFDINGEAFEVGDDGQDMVVIDQIIIWYDTSPLGLVNKPADYSDENNPIPSVLVPGHHCLLYFRDETVEANWLASKDALPWLDETYDAADTSFGAYTLKYKDLGNGLRLYDGASLPDGLLDNTNNNDLRACVPPEEPVDG